MGYVCGLSNAGNRIPATAPGEGCPLHEVLRISVEPGNTFVFLRGDANSDGVVDISDPVFTLGFLFLGTDAPSCEVAADATDDGIVDMSDSIYTLDYLFKGGPVLPTPYPDCGGDSTPDTLSCNEYPLCMR